MQSIEALKVAIRMSGVSTSKLSVAAGKSRGWASSLLTRGDVRTETAATIAHLCGYRLELVPADADRAPGSIPIDAPADVERIEPLGKPYI